jgi:hypothetical protein
MSFQFDFKNRTLSCVIIIDTEVRRFGAKINDTEIYVRRVDVTSTWSYIGAITFGA